jgi:hypothetical protein
VLPEDAKIDLTVITDDNGLQGLAGRIGMAAKSGTFKRFLTKKVKESAPAEEESMEEEAPMDSAESTDTLFAGRM